MSMMGTYTYNFPFSKGSCSNGVCRALWAMYLKSFSDFGISNEIYSMCTSQSNVKESVEKNVNSGSRSRTAEENSVDSQSSTKETNIKRQLNPLDPFQDRWKTVNLGGKTTFHVYSAFALKSKDNQGFHDQIRITAAIPSVYAVSTGW